MQYLKTHQQSMGIFFLCAVVVFVTQFAVLQPVLQYRLFNITEDWPFIVLYNFLDLNILDKLVYIWKTNGLHTSAQVFHIGILSEFLGFNYSAYQVVNVALKTIGTLSFFPLILILFKNKKLAFLATILFGLSSTTAGSFLWIVKGSEYIGIAFLNIFLITYYYVILRKSRFLLLLSSFLYLSAYLMAPPRMFPQLLLVAVVEIYWLLKTRQLGNLKISAVRVILFIIPVILISLPAPVSPGFPFTKQPFILLRNILDGNLHNLLDPFAGIGWTLLTNNYWQFFGKLNLNTFTNLENYLFFILSGPAIIFGILTLILSFFLAGKPVRFFLLIFISNFLAEILMFFIANDNFRIASNIVVSDNRDHFVFTKYPTIVGIYIFVVTFAAFWEWRKNQANNLLRAMWVGPVFAAVFLWPTWVVMGPLINDWSSVHWYFGIPAMGLVLFYEKLKHGKLSRLFAILIILAAVVIFYQSHKIAVAKQYLGINSERVSLKEQQKLHGQLLENLGNSAKTGDILVYLEITEDLVNLRRTSQFYKGALVTEKFGDWVHFRREETDGCIAAIVDKQVLRTTVVVERGEKGFLYKGICILNDSVGGRLFVNKESVFYKPDDFYALRLQNGEFIDIRDEILKELDFGSIP
ncbi:hypothetical protein HYW43_01010 [Candidatus Daviesbacteria bacterium]|nr:hypothetical protein [Candidatus Daviesbacteria bacterium]